ncbi:MAG: lamin tail domain-containing protein, partial [Planctomycetota bacterium]
GRAYGRLGGRGRWAYLAAPTPGAPNGEDELQPPSWRFRHGIAPRDGEVYEIWFQPLPPPGGPPGPRPRKASVRLREEGAGEFEERAMAWDEKEYRFSARIERAGKRIAYYFTAESPDGIERAYPLPAPALAYAVPVLPEAKINEVLPRPLPNRSGPPEFIEIYNPSDSPIDLGGCFLTDTRRNPIRWRIPAGTTVGPKGFAVFYADGRDRGDHTSFRLSNTGEYVGLYGRTEEGNLLIDSLVYRGLRAGESWGALPDGTRNFRAWKDPTPGARNIPKIPEGYLEAKTRKRSGAEPEPGESAAPEPEEGK